MKTGIILPHHEIGTDPGAIRAFVKGAEELGAAHIMIYDHVVGADRNRPGGFEGPYDKDVQFHEPFTFFSYVAALTTRIELVTGIIILPQRQTALVAKQAAELAILSENRLRLGIGTGWNTVEYEVLNEDFTNRGRRQEEQVELMRRFWQEDCFSYEGKYHQFTLAGINPRPSQPVPIWFGGGAPALLDRCARLGDGWMSVTGPDKRAEAAIESMRATRQAAGLSWESFGIHAQVQARGGMAESWQENYNEWQAMGATDLSIATHNAGYKSVDEHLQALETWLGVVSSGP
ncbi:MAG: LLM class F420-dependent oxidoreductase [Pseudomonadales bacterium]|nr:LLM class F420-dependent oxidoreductase [Pseudomonadales bacterium]